MKYSREDIIQYIREDDVKFIRLSFCDVFGKQKNISIMPGELKRAFEYGIAFDASAIDGFGDETKCDLLLHSGRKKRRATAYIQKAVFPWFPGNCIFQGDGFSVDLFITESL